MSRLQQQLNELTIQVQKMPDDGVLE
jgi:hypothetical protein